MSSDNLETRERILQSAWKLLEDGTASAVRMSDIAKAAGVSRQAVYLHFPKRAELLVAMTRYLDEVKNVDGRLEKSRGARSGRDRLDAFVEAWGNYIPEIYGVAKALLAMKDTDLEAEMAWNNRMEAVRQGCEAAVRDLKRDGDLMDGLTQKQATELLWMLLSVRNWEQLTRECGWSQKQYIKLVKSAARRMLVVQQAG
ncbi:TetR/AcrR family transcriptional regulator [Hoeflea prorocentri]|uniref:TetR/AcrR family transcriptional regulator n=1 Tax=Hoeflea prorocentri TaxID=1922333 RepID=A0A9X3UEW8_9HYPH|nr:TetR/AcrR family transcriptional regulator [Hoeflea prorocentri]MCY6379451.1 TetR/AcrR family transcriptional regulator [Hoeflea prorocentri]MDA5397251.1 TetR/AcrR family transcriptional regulator [Hoeflea prorocentri]